MASHAAQQHVLLECPGICQLVNTMKSLVPDRRYSNLEIHCCSTLCLFPATTQQLWRLTLTLHAPRTPRRCSYRSLASIPRSAAAPLKGPLKDIFWKGRLCFTKTQLSKEVADRLSALAELAPRFFAKQDHEESRHQALQPPRCNGKSGGVHSVLRSGVQQRLCPHRRLSERHLYHSVTRDKNKVQADTRAAVAPWSCIFLFLDV